MLLDSSVLVAAAVSSHPFHVDAEATVGTKDSFIVAAHSLAEFYNTLSKPRGYAWPPRDAALAVVQAQRRFEVAALDAREFGKGIAAFAAIGGVGARLYDFMIGYHAIVRDIASIVTLNERDFSALFPNLEILTPAQYLDTR